MHESIDKGILSFLGNNRGKSAKRFSAFTVAEMLLVLLIVSFLIIALPPLVNKKIVKNVVRGEHGRYECWIDPDDGSTWEYLSTERHGITGIYNQIVGKLGHKLGEGERCRFKPAEMAPTAPYFAMQIIGGGGGGAFPPYNPASDVYRKENYIDKGKVKYLQTNENIGGAGGERAYLHSGSDFFNFRTTYYHAANGNGTQYFGGTNYNYQQFYQSKSADPNNYSKTGLQYYQNCQAKNWVYDYFPPVLNRVPLTVCSGHGMRGLGKAFPGQYNELVDQFVPAVYQTDANGNIVYDSGGNPIIITPEVHKYTVTLESQFGGRGGYGYCVNIPAHTIALSGDAESYFLVKTKSLVNSADWAAYISFNRGQSFYPYNYAKFKYHRYPNGVELNSGDRISLSSGDIGVSGEVFLDNVLQYSSNTNANGINNDFNAKIKLMACPWTSDNTGSVGGGNIPPIFTGNKGACNSSNNGNTLVACCSKAIGFRGANPTQPKDEEANRTGPERLYFFSNSGTPNWSDDPDSNLLSASVFKDVEDANYFANNGGVSFDMGVEIHADKYIEGTTQIGEDGVPEFVPAYTANANCSIPGGHHGYSYFKNSRGEYPSDYDYSPPVDVQFSDLNNDTYDGNSYSCDSIWQDAGSNQNEALNGRKYTVPEVSSYREYGEYGNSGAASGAGVVNETKTPRTNDLFPMEILMKRVVTEDTNTFGFGGRPGESVSFYFSRLTGTLEFDIGDGGDPGEYGGDISAAEERESRRGKTGGDTIVWRKATGVSDNLECRLNSDGTISDDSVGCSTLVVAKGGRGYRDGASGRKIIVRGNRTCKRNGGYFVQIDGCLDAGVGPASIGGISGGNVLRFAENSNFYTIPELDKESTTKSAIELVFKDKNLPGSGGDGGYSFLWHLNPNSTEKVTAMYHPNFTPQSMKSQTGDDWDVVQDEDYTLIAGRGISDTELDFEHYRCYLRQDAEGVPRENADLREVPKKASELGMSSAYNDSAFCLPHKGLPGAVVIVW